LIPIQNVKADDSYRVETHGPRIGTRILLFIKDLAYGDNPNDRYERLPSNRQPAMPQQPTYGARQQRYSLDEPPPVNSMPPQRPAQFAQDPSVGGSRTVADRDTPYTSADALPSPPREREAQHAEVGSHEENLPPAKLKKTAPAQKPAPSKPVVQEKPAKSSPPKETVHAQESPKETQTISNSSVPTKRSWQAFSGDAGKGKQSSTEAASENKKVTSTPSVSHDATLTGSKTTKEGRVKSPYAPFNELDVTGLPAGSLAMDPTTGKVFRVP
jgi:hypothetical protein